MASRRIDEHTIGVLEFDQVRTLLASFATSSLGRRVAESLYPSTDRSWITARMGETTELKRLLDEAVRIPLAGISDIDELLTGFGKSKTVLEPEELLRISDTLAACGRMKVFLENLDRTDYPNLNTLASRLDNFDPIAEQINRCVDSDNTIKDEASEKLAHLRRESRTITARIHARFEAIVSSPHMRRAVENDKFMMRHGRPVVALKANYRSHMHGTVLDRSNTGATLYIEPDELVELSNELEDVLFEEKKEVGRILFELTRSVLDEKKAILANVRILGFLDLTFAKAAFSQACDMSPPSIEPGSAFELRDARHPLLLKLFSDRDGCDLRDARDKVVPIDVRLGDDFDLLLVTGPNTGGKTVMLKTVGLLVLMAQSGMHIPARLDSKLCVYRRIFADIGDEQSIQQSLSTFSAHMCRIVGILDNADKGTLVLLDELGAGTDPIEGAALSEAILDAMASGGARVVATTHLGQLKSYAYSCPRAQNASVQFDRKTLGPTYRLQIGTPGSSNALAIAARVGLPDPLIDRARSLLADDSSEGTELINQVQATREAAEESRDQAHAELDRARRTRTKAKAELDRVRQYEKRIQRTADREIDKSMRQVRSAARDYLESVKNAPKQWLDPARGFCDLVEDLAASTSLARRQMEFFESLSKGDTVYVISFRTRGLVDRIRRKKKALRVNLGDKQVEVGFEDVCHPADVPGC